MSRVFSYLSYLMYCQASKIIESTVTASMNVKVEATSELTKQIYAGFRAKYCNNTNAIILSKMLITINILTAFAHLLVNVIWRVNNTAKMHPDRAANILNIVMASEGAELLPWRMTQHRMNYMKKTIAIKYLEAIVSLVLWKCRILARVYMIG